MYYKTGKSTMQNTYTQTVIATIENFAAAISNAAHDSVVEKNDYSIDDNMQALNFVYENFAAHTSVASLASAALNSSLDTVVRENLYNILIN